MDLVQQDLMQLLDEIEKRGPLEAIPALPGLAPSQARAAAELAARRSWTTTGAFRRNGTVRSDVLDLTDNGHAAVRRMRIEHLSPSGEPSTSSIGERRARRGQLMAQLYGLVGDDTRRTVLPAELAAALAWNEAEVRRVARFLAENDLIAVRDREGRLAITSAGIAEVEEARHRPDEGSEHLAGNVIHASGPVQMIQSSGSGSVSVDMASPTSEDTSSRTSKVLLAIVLGVISSIIAAVLLAGFGGDDDEPGTASTTTTPETTSPTTTTVASADDPSLDVQVQDLAPAPEQVASAGLQIPEDMPSHAISVLPGEPEIVLTYEGWNRIVGTSDVPKLVDIIADDELNLDPTGYNRFQYLADRISQYDIDDFRPVGVASGFDADESGLIVIAALYNPTDEFIRLDHLEVEVVGRNDQSRLGAGRFYDDAPPSIPPRTMVFARFNLVESTSETRDTNGIAYQFGFNTTPCGAAAC